jgi:hypothetical protein
MLSRRSVWKRNLWLQDGLARLRSGAGRHWLRAHSLSAGTLNWKEHRRVRVSAHKGTAGVRLVAPHRGSSAGRKALPLRSGGPLPLFLGFLWGSLARAFNFSPSFIIGLRMRQPVLERKRQSTECFLRGGSWYVVRGQVTIKSLRCRDR